MKKKITFLLILAAAFMFIFHMGSHIMEVFAATPDTEAKEDNYDASFTFSFSSASGITAEELHNRANGDGLFTFTTVETDQIHTLDEFNNQVDVTYITSTIDFTNKGSLTIVWDGETDEEKAAALSGTVYYVLPAKTDENGNIVKDESDNPVSIDTADLYMFYYDVVAEKWLSPYDSELCEYNCLDSSYNFYKATFTYARVDTKTHKLIYLTDPNTVYDSVEYEGKNYCLSAPLYTYYGLTSPEDRFFKEGVSLNAKETTIRGMLVDIWQNGNTVNGENWYSEISFYNDKELTIITADTGIYYEVFYSAILKTYTYDSGSNSYTTKDFSVNFDADGASKVAEFYSQGESYSGNYTVGSIIPVYYEDEITHELVERVAFIESVKFSTSGGTPITEPENVQEDYRVVLYLVPADNSFTVTAEINKNYVNKDDHQFFTAEDMTFTMISSDLSVLTPVWETATSDEILYGVYEDRFYYAILYGHVKYSFELQMNFEYVFDDETLSLYTPEWIAGIAYNTCTDVSGATIGSSGIYVSYYTVEAETSDGLQVDGLGIFSSDTTSLNFSRQWYFWVRGLEENKKISYTIVRGAERDAEGKLTGNDPDSIFTVSSGINYIRLSNTEYDEDLIEYDNHRSGQVILKVSEVPFEDSDSRTYHVYYYISKNDPYLYQYDYDYTPYVYDDNFIRDYYEEGMGAEGTFHVYDMAAVQEYSYGETITMPEVSNLRPRDLLYWYCPSLKGILGQDITTITDDIIVYGVWTYYNEASVEVNVNPYADNAMDNLEFGLSLSASSYESYSEAYPLDLAYKVVYADGQLVIHYDKEYTGSLYLFAKYDGLSDYVFVSEINEDFLKSTNIMDLYQVVVDTEVPDSNENYITVNGNGWYFRFTKDGVISHPSDATVSFTILDGYKLDTDSYAASYSLYPLDASGKKIEFTPSTAVYLKLKVIPNVHTLTYSFKDAGGNDMLLYDVTDNAVSNPSVNYNMVLKGHVQYFFEENTKILYWTGTGDPVVYLIYKVEYYSEDNNLQTVTGRMLDMNLNAIVYAKIMDQTPLALSLTLDGENQTSKINNAYFIATDSATSIANIKAIGFCYDSASGLYHSASTDAFYVWYSFNGKNYAYIGEYVPGTTTELTAECYSLNLTLSDGLLKYLKAISYIEGGCWNTPESSMTLYYSDHTANKNVYFDFNGEYEAALDTSVDNSPELCMEDYVLKASSMTSALSASLICEVKKYKITYQFKDVYWSSLGNYLVENDANVNINGNQYASVTQWVPYDSVIEFDYYAEKMIVLNESGQRIIYKTEITTAGIVLKDNKMPAQDFNVMVYGNSSFLTWTICSREWIDSNGTSDSKTGTMYKQSILTTDNVFLSSSDTEYIPAEGQYLAYDQTNYFRASNINGNRNYILWYKNPDGEMMYFGTYSSNQDPIIFYFGKVNFTLSGDNADMFDTAEALTSSGTPVVKDTDYSYHAYIIMPYSSGGVGESDPVSFDLHFQDGYKLADTSLYFETSTGKVVGASQSADTISIWNLYKNITIKLYAEPKDYTVYYFETEDDYLSYYGTGDTSLVFRTASVAYLTSDPEFYASGDSQYDESSNKRLASWIDSKTGKIAVYDYMPCNDLYLYGNWIDCSAITIELSMKDYDAASASMKERRTAGMLQLSSSKTEFSAITSDQNPDGIFTYDSVNGTYTFVYNSINKDSNYIWIIYPYTDEAVYFMDADDVMSRNYTLYKFNNENPFTDIPFEISNGGWYEAGTADVIFTVKDDVTDDSYLGYILSDSDSDEAEYITFTRFETDDGKIILRARIKNFAMDTAGHEIIGNEYAYHISVTKRVFYIYYYSNKRKLLETQTYYYGDSITQADGAGYNFGSQTFADWVDADGNSLSMYSTMPLSDIVVYARLSDFKYMTATFHSPSDNGLSAYRIYVSLSDKVFDRGSNAVTVNGTTLTFKFRGTGYLWYWDTESSEYKYLGTYVMDGMDLYFIKITTLFDTPHLEFSGLGYRIKDTLDSVMVTPDPGYSFTADGYRTMEDRIILTNTSRDLSIGVREVKATYTISYCVRNEVVHEDTYNYGDAVTMWEYEGDFSFFMWSETIETMPANNVVVYAYQNAVYTVYEYPSASKIHEGQSLADSVFTGGKICIGTEVISGTYSFKNKDIIPSKEDSMKTEYEVIFTPSSKDKVPYTFTLTIEVCNPQYPSARLIAPVLLKRTDHMLSFMVNSSYEYSMDGNTYYSGTTVNLYNQMPDTEFLIYYRYMADLDYCESDTLTITFRTYSEDEYLYVLAQENAEAIIIKYQRVLDYSDVRALMADYSALTSISYEDSDMSGADATELVEYMSEVFSMMAEIDEYRGSMKNLNSSRTEWYSETRCAEISELALASEPVQLIENYKNFIISVFDSADYMVGLYEVNNSDLNGIKLTSLEDGGMDTESVYVISKVDELMKYGYDQYKNIDVKDYQNSFVAGTVGLMSDSVKAVHSCDGTSVTSIIGTKVSAVQTLTYLDYKFDREAYDKAFYIAAEAAVVAHIQGIVLEDLASQYALMLSTLTDVNKRSMLAVVYVTMSGEYEDYDTFKAMYDEIIGDDGSVTYEDCLELFHQQIVKNLVVPVTSGLSSVELIILISFAAVITGCVIFAVVRYEVKRRRLIYERR